VSNVSLLAGLSRFALRMKAIRQVPDGLCSRCDGTGAGEALGELGEAFSHGGELPIDDCKSCSGTGMAMARVEVTGLGLMLLFPIAVAVYQNKRKRTSRLIVPVPTVAGPPTRELLSLRDAFDMNGPISHKPDLNAISAANLPPPGARNPADDRS
jgi:hypothetical protein